MFLQNLRAKVGARLNGDSEAGFQLTDVLGVMLIHGILAAIAIPAFFNQREKATGAQAKSAAGTAETAMETYATEAGGKYTGATAAKLHEIEPTLVASGTKNNVITLVPVPTADEFTVTSEAGTGDTFSITREAGGVVKFNCTGKGGCPTGGDWSK